MSIVFVFMGFEPAIELNNNINNSSCDSLESLTEWILDCVWCCACLEYSSSC